MTNLVALAYGRENEYQRAILAVLSYYGWLNNDRARTVVFTDNPAYFSPYFAGLPVEYQLLTPEKIRELKGPANFVHRLKVAVVDEALRLYTGENILFIDSDTFVTANPSALLARISPTVSLMHLREFALQERRHEDMCGRLIRLLETESFSTTKGEERFTAAQYSWNSGVLGLAPTVAADMPDVFLLTEKFFAASGWHISEQMAFSLVLQTRTEVLATDTCIYHYWQGSKKLAADALLAKLLIPQFAALPLAEKLAIIRPLTQQLATQIVDYLKAHPEIELREQALYSFQIKRFAAGYGLAGRYLLKKPTDTKFLKDVLYYTRQRVRG